VRRHLACPDKSSKTEELQKSRFNKDKRKHYPESEVQNLQY
jgi:hypothetical protein